MIMDYPEYNSVTSRHGYPRLAISAAFGVHDVPWLADCISDGTGLSRVPDDRAASELMAESPVIERSYDNGRYRIRTCDLTGVIRAL